MHYTEGILRRKYLQIDRYLIDLLADNRRMPDRSPCDLSKIITRRRSENGLGFVGATLLLLDIASE